MNVCIPLNNDKVDAETKKVSYLWDPNQIYTYAIDFGNTGTYTFDKKENNVWYWKMKSKNSGRIIGSKQKETEKGFYFNNFGYDSRFEDDWVSLPLPTKKGKKFTDEWGKKSKIIKTNATVIIKAGKFKNVVITENSSENFKFISYYAPGYGLIKQFEKNNKDYVVCELIKVQKKKNK